MRFRAVTIVVVAAIAVAAIAAAVATPANGYPSQVQACTNCHPAAPVAATVSATPSTATPAPGAAYNLTVSLAGLTSSGDTGYWISNQAGTPAFSAYAGATGTDQTSYVRTMTAPSVAGTYRYTVWCNRGSLSSGQAKSTTYSITVPAATPLNITAPTATSSWPSGSTQSVTWTVNPAYATGEFKVGLLNAAGTIAYINKLVPVVAAKTSYSTSFAVAVPAASGYKAFVSYRPVAGTGLWTLTAKSAAFVVTPIRITAPTATSSWPSGSTQSVTWTVNPAYATGEFKVGLLNAAGTIAYINKLVPVVAAKTSYSTSFAVAVPAASGYKAFVSYRPVAGTGLWTLTAKSAAFVVTPIRITAPTATSSWPSGSTQSVTWTVNPAYATGEFKVGLLNAAGTIAYINKLVPVVAAKTSYSTSFAVAVPAASGYKAFVSYRPVAGTGLWTLTAKSAAFVVTP